VSLAPPPVPPLPRLVVVTDSLAARRWPLLEVIAAAVRGGARAVLLRDKHLPRSERHRLAGQIRELLAPVGGVLVVASDSAIPADGIHLAAAEPVPEPVPALLGRSCHSRGEVALAATEGCRYATLSPIFPTCSKPGYGPALGPASLAGLPLPVWALGGVTPANAAACVKAGATGIAVMGTIMRAADPARTVTAFNHAMQEMRDNQRPEEA
jgi:thiamine-phosphate diphosphorylase